MNARKLRHELSETVRASASDAIAQHVLSVDELSSAQSICCYVSVGAEVGTEGLIDALLAAGKTVSVPVVGDDGRMVAARIASRAELVAGQWGIAVPRVVSVREQKLDVIICPGLLFTRAGHRLGRGGGHYDRFLADHPEAYALGLCFEAQLIDALPTEPHDRTMHAVVTEQSIYHAASP